MAKNLEEVRNDLYALFNNVAEKAKTTKNWDWTHWSSLGHLVQSAAQTAEAIAVVEREIREQKAADDQGLKGLKS